MKDRVIKAITNSGEVLDKIRSRYFRESSLSTQVFTHHTTSIRKHSNIQKFHHQKLKVSDKNSDIFHISDQNIDCGYSLETPCRGSSYEYPQSMFLSRNIMYIMYTPVNPSFTI